MANIVRLNVYQINNRLMDPGTPLSLGFPTQGNILLWDTLNSPTRSLPTGVNVYAAIQVSSSGAANSQGDMYYVAENMTQLLALFNA